jgi:hypothetical protein
MMRAGCGENRADDAAIEWRVIARRRPFGGAAKTKFTARRISNFGLKKCRDLPIISAPTAAQFPHHAKVTSNINI